MVARQLRNRAAGWALLLCSIAVLSSSPLALARSHFYEEGGIAGQQGNTSLGTVPVAQLPSQAAATLLLIAQGGPFPYSKDGAVFGNFERQLPRETRGYYREYTVPTPRARNRGARRIICGGRPRSTAECYYTGDHYASFKRIVG